MERFFGTAIDTKTLMAVVILYYTLVYYNSPTLALKIHLFIFLTI